MPPITFQDLPLNIYMVIFGTGIFIFVLSLIFCCYFISKLRHQAQCERFGYKEVVLKGDAKKLNLHGQTCAVCLEDFKVKDELGVLPCQHAFHRKQATSRLLPQAEVQAQVTVQRRLGYQGERSRSPDGSSLFLGSGHRLSARETAVCRNNTSPGSDVQASLGSDVQASPGGELASLDDRKQANRCLVKWLEVRCVCPMCNKPIAGTTEPHHGIGALLDELV
ncbi:UNVERIFIED_CONTAM: hypothetical protein FKN15_063614 [Acipenser sinensis]